MRLLPFFLAFYISRRRLDPKSIYSKHLRLKLSPQRTELALYKPPPKEYNESMKVERYTIETRLKGHANEYHVLRYWLPGKELPIVHTSKRFSYIRKLASTLDKSS